MWPCRTSFDNGNLRQYSEQHQNTGSGFTFPCDALSGEKCAAARRGAELGWGAYRAITAPHPEQPA